MLKYLQLQMISMLQSMQCNDSQQRGLITIAAKGLTWHAAQYINYGSRQCACMPWVILFLQKLIPRKNCGRCAIYLTEVIQEGVKNLLLQKRHTQRKLVMSMGVSKTTVHHWIVVSTIHVHCNSLRPVLTEQNFSDKVIDGITLQGSCESIMTCLIRSIWTRSGPHNKGIVSLCCCTP